jgi:hypothetical protein
MTNLAETAVVRVLHSYLFEPWSTQTENKLHQDLRNALESVGLSMTSVSTQFNESDNRLSGDVEVNSRKYHFEAFNSGVKFNDI